LNIGGILTFADSMKMRNDTFPAGPGSSMLSAGGGVLSVDGILTMQKTRCPHPGEAYTTRVLCYYKE